MTVDVAQFRVDLEALAPRLGTSLNPNNPKQTLDSLTLLLLLYALDKIDEIDAKIEDDDS